MVNELGKWCDESMVPPSSLDAFKIIYAAPMKALVQEMAGNFNSHLGPFGIKAGKLTGDPTSQPSAQSVVAALLGARLLI